MLDEHKFLHSELHEMETHLYKSGVIGVSTEPLRLLLSHALDQQSILARRTVWFKSAHVQSEGTTRHENHELAIIADHACQVPGLAQLVETCISTDAELRPSAREMWDALRRRAACSMGLRNDKRTFVSLIQTDLDLQITRIFDQFS